MLIFKPVCNFDLKEAEKKILTEKIMLALEWEIHYARFHGGDRVVLVPHVCYRKKKFDVGPRGQFYFPTARHAKISQADLVPLTKSLLFAWKYATCFTYLISVNSNSTLWSRYYYPTS